MKRLILFVLAALPVIGCGTGKQTELTGLPLTSPEDVGLSSAVLERCDSAIVAAINDSSACGAVLCIVKDDRIAYRKAYGYRALVPEKEEMTEDTVFDLASLSKCVGTTLSFMQLIEQGLVTTEDRVDKFIPGFAPWKDEQTGEDLPITIMDLMTHVSGLPAGVNKYTFAERFGTNCPDSLEYFIAKEMPRLNRPGTTFRYSCPNFISLAYVLQHITGQRLCDYAQEHVFTPLGLKNTCYFPTDEEIPAEKLAKIAPTTVQEDGFPFRGQVHDPPARMFNMGNSGNAGVFSTADDLAVISSMILGGGEYQGVRILQPETVERMSSVPEGCTVGRTLGWDVSSPYANFSGKLDGDHLICHTGYTGTSILIDFDRNLAIILLANRVHPKDTGNMKATRKAVSDIVFDSIIQ